MLVVLIDPDKASPQHISRLCGLFADSKPDMLFVGGSLVCSAIDDVVAELKRQTDVPVVLFPGNAAQLSPQADALLMLSLISGRNADYLIGQHVHAAPAIAQSGIEVIPTGYMLIESGVQTSVEYISNTKPIPRGKTDIALATAMAGEQLGLRMLYLEAGSGAQQPVPAEMISAVRQKISIPLIVGGGLRSREAIAEAYNAGADIVVVGTAVESDPEILRQFV